MRTRTREKLLVLIDSHEEAAEKYAERPCTTAMMRVMGTKDTLLEAIFQHLPEICGDIRRGKQ